MDELKFLQVLTDIEDDLILDAKKPVTPKRSISSLFGKIGVAAALLCLLSVTVMAVSFSVWVLSSDHRVPIMEAYYMGVFTPSSKVTTVNYDLEAREITIPQRWTENLKAAWKTFDYDHKYFKGIDLKEEDGSRIDFGHIAQVERLLGLELVSSPEIDSAAGNVFVSLVIVDSVRASREWERKGTVTPDGIRIYLPFRLDGQKGLNDDVIEYCGLHIFIPLTESFATEYRSHVVLSGDGSQDLKERKILSHGGIETVLLANTQSEYESMKAFAAWEYQGVGYLLEMKTYDSVTADPGKIMIPYLANLED